MSDHTDDLITCSRTRQLKLASYDRLFPNQDTMPKGGFGNLIALPLQKMATRTATDRSSRTAAPHGRGTSKVGCVRCRNEKNAGSGTAQNG